ncbi:30S ribosomal protein S6 [Candidatus Parcubacteria bacterium]|nr:30S ribosomal protein S6 [Patescibacteria group bacterium]MCG2693768.1 30S ribosomal protein S6 [Candidatus Parcubacteria bacterium]
MYELLYIVPALYTEGELKNITDKIAGKLKEEGVDVKSSKEMGKLKFAYPMEKHTAGFYILVDFDAEGEALKKINRALQLEKDVLRFMITKKLKTVKAVEIKEFKATDIAPSAKKERRDKTPIRQPKEKAKMKLEDIDKKLDILLEKEII